MSDNEDFEHNAPDQPGTIAITAGIIKKGDYCMLKGFPCRVTEFSTAKPGKHGTAKATIVGIDIFTNKKYEECVPTSGTMRAPVVTNTIL